ncbi:MAG: hypothetical protein HY574_08155 [candidate division NC10 bacterium]|nr:hypothetical protein [candidate division NC10 bacterium]
MTKHIFMLLFAAALFVCGTTVGWAEGLSPEVKAQLCQEKKAGLTKLEAEAPEIRAQLAQKEPELEAARTEMDKWDKLSVAVVAGAVPGWLQTTATLAGLDPTTYVNQQHGKAANKVGPLRDAIRSLKQRQTEVGSQIFLLRDIIEGLGCDTPTPPVDYNAINQLGQQSQQLQPGSQTTTSGQSVQPQGSYAAPSSGFGPSGSTQPTGQQGQQPGYGQGPDTGSFKPPKYGEIQETIQGSIGEKPGMGKPG